MSQSPGGKSHLCLATTGLSQLRPTQRSGIRALLGRLILEPGVDVE
jgi:hypothetical protein